MKQELIQKQKLPEGWHWSTIQAVCKTKPQGGGTPLSTNPSYYGGNIPWVITEDLTSAGKYISSTLKKITKLGFDNSNVRLFPKGTILFAMYGSIGRMSITQIELTTNQAILGLIPNDKIIISEYLYYYLDFAKNILIKKGRGGTQANINAKMVCEFPILLPPLPVQQQIVAKLDAQMTQIEIMKKVAEKEKEASEEMKRAFLFKLFNFDNKSPKGWKELSVEQLLEPNNKKAITMGPFGSSLKKDELVNEGVQVLWISNIKENNFLASGTSFITEKKYKELEGFTVHAVDLIMTTMGTIGLIAIVPKNIPKSIISSHLIRIRFNKNLVDPRLMVYLLSPYSPAYRSIYDRAHGAIMKGLNTSIIKNTKINLPPITQQESLLSNIEMAFSHFEDIDKNISQKLSAISQLLSSILNEVFGVYEIPNGIENGKD